MKILDCTIMCMTCPFLEKKFIDKTMCAYACIFIILKFSIYVGYILKDAY